jgi:hypothetical protein
MSEDRLNQELIKLYDEAATALREAFRADQRYSYQTWKHRIDWLDQKLADEGEE